VQRIKFKQLDHRPVPVLRYSFGIVNWRQEELQKLERKNEETTNHSQTASPEVDADHLYVPSNREEGA
jgi:hypothetical protein